MSRYKRTFNTLEETKEYACVSLVRCVVSGILKANYESKVNYTLDHLYKLIKQSRWYAGILDDCKNLGLSSDKILNAILPYLNDYDISLPIPFVYEDKVFWIWARMFWLNPTVTCSYHFIPEEELDNFKEVNYDV